MPVQDFGLGFSGVEAIQFWISVAVMTLAFAIWYIGGAQYLGVYFQLGGASLVLLIITGSFVAVMTAFLLHELAHKAVAQRIGVVAEYRYAPIGLLMALVTASIGWIIAIPGAVVVSGRISARQHARISAAGPASNLAFAALFISLSIAFGTAPGRFREPIPIFIGTIVFFNLILAGFNLIPVPRIAFRRKIWRIPVKVDIPASDGFLILVSSKVVWAALVVALFALSIEGLMLAVF
jgi:Zn-dependent protease